MKLETFSKSRAQEVRVALDNLIQQYKEMGVRIDEMKNELRARCPHPDGYMRKLDSLRPKNPILHAPVDWWYCNMCHTTFTKKGETN